MAKQWSVFSCVPILHSALQMPKYCSPPNLSNQSHVFAFWMLHSHLTCLLLQQAALGGPVIVAPAISHLLQSGHIHRGEPWQRLQVPREVLLPQLGGVCGQKPSREKWEEERGVGVGRQNWAGVNTAVSSDTRKPAVKFKCKHLKREFCPDKVRPTLMRLNVEKQRRVAR